MASDRSSISHGIVGLPPNCSATIFALLLAHFRHEEAPEDVAEKQPERDSDGYGCRQIDYRRRGRVGDPDNDEGHTAEEPARMMLRRICFRNARDRSASRKPTSTASSTVAS